MAQDVSNHRTSIQTRPRGLRYLHTAYQLYSRNIHSQRLSRQLAPRMFRHMALRPQHLRPMPWRTTKNNDHMLTIQMSSWRPFQHIVHKVHQSCILYPTYRNSTSHHYTRYLRRGHSSHFPRHHRHNSDTHSHKAQPGTSAESVVYCP